MPEVKQILAGREAVDAYRKAHNKLHENVTGDSGSAVDHSRILDKMLSTLNALGFNSIDEFMTANMQAILADMATCIWHEGECDNCEGREEVRGCEPKCYEQNTTGRGRTSVIPDIEAEGEATINYFMDYGKSLPPRRKGRISQMLPNCSIVDHLVEDPALDWDWR